MQNQACEHLLAQTNRLFSPTAAPAYRHSGLNKKTTTHLLRSVSFFYHANRQLA